MEEEKKQEKLRVISEDAKITIPIKTLLSVIAGVAFLVASHYQVNSRIQHLEHQIALMNVEIEENDTWIDNYKPSEASIDTYNRVRTLEGQLMVLEERIKGLSK